jgi:hypothetical protein
MFDIYLCCVHNEFWDRYEWGEKNHKYKQGKTSIMIGSKVMVPTYEPDFLCESIL